MDYERELKKRIGAIYAEADMKLERAQLDLLEPEAAPHTLRDVRTRRVEASNRALEEQFRAIGRSLAESMEQIRRYAAAMKDGINSAARQLPRA